jgi:hypothetical protein
VPIIAAIILVSTALTLSPIVYQAIEKIQMVLVAIIVIFLVMAIFIATELSAWTGIITEAPTGVANLPRYIGEVGATFILGAIAFAGAGEANNLCQSNYIRDKGLGIGRLMPRIVSPITGERDARPSLGYTWPVNEENLRRWRGWWEIANQEQLTTFLGIGLALLIALSVLVFSTVGVVPVGEEADPTFIKEEGQIFGERIGTWFHYFFYLVAAVILISTSIGIMDYAAGSPLPSWRSATSPRARPSLRAGSTPRSLGSSPAR